MAREQGYGRQNGRRNGAKRRGPVFRAFERFVLSLGMSIVAFVIERRLLKALKTGSAQAAPRTAAGRDELLLPEEAGEPPREADLTTSRQQVVEQAGG